MAAPTKYPGQRTITPKTGPDAGIERPVTDRPPAAPGGTNTETGEQESVDEAVDRMSGAVPARQNQSTDHMNQY